MIKSEEVKKEKKMKSEGLEDLSKIASEILSFAGDIRFFAFEGEMGAGKTTLIQQLAQCLNVVDKVQSPTFSIAHEYLTEKGESIFHLDFYRIESEQEAFHLGYEEYFYDENAYCWVEWASKVKTLLPQRRIHIEIIVEENYRIIQLKKYE